MKKLYLLILLFITVVSTAQFSKTHYIPPLSGSDNTSSSAQEQYLYISTPSTAPVNFTIKQLGGINVTGTVSKSTPYVYNIGNGTNTQLMVPKNNVNNILSNKGFIVEAEDLVYVAARIIAGNSNQAGAVVSKGMAALGTRFRIGSLLNTTANPYTDNHYTFVAIMATENNTLVTFSDIRTGAQLINNAIAGSTPAPITLNSGESFVMAVQGPTDANRDALIGSLVNSDKPIAVNCGSFTGSNAATNLDLGFDQIVSAERTGKEYVFIKSTGQADVEKVLLTADVDNTEIYLNNNTGLPNFILNAGEYLVLDGNQFVSGSLYVRSSEKVFAYQTVGDDTRTDFANQEMFFVPPLGCDTPHIIDNIPMIEKIGSRIFQGRVTILTEAGSTLQFEVNGTTYSLTALDALAGVSVNGPTTVPTQNQSFDTYTITGLTGNITVLSTTQLYVAAYGTDGAATFGGFYSGFTFKPEISFNLLAITQTNCIVPNIDLRVTTLSPFDNYQWYFNGNPIPGATLNHYSPPQPGAYYVKAAISNCNAIGDIYSNEIPVSTCPTDSDNDTVNDNVDIDYDNDGLSNCSESFGNQPIDLVGEGSILITTGGNDAPEPVPFSGTTIGSFVTRTPMGKGNFVKVEKTFPQPINVALEYASNANSSDFITSSGDFILSCNTSQTITVLNPTDQLLIDTNYDNIYESGVTSYSSYEIRFRLKDALPLAAGTGTFQFRCNKASSLSLKHINLSDNSGNNATFKLIYTCVQRDSDSDGIPDSYDLDSDNDGIPDRAEALGNTALSPANADNNKDGMDDAFGTGINPNDNDNDGVVNNIDLDSDNDGIFDLFEAGHAQADANLDGRIDGLPSVFGSNGLSNALETSIESGTINYVIADTDSNSVKNYLSIDSDNDNCFDVIEAGFQDGDGNGILGSGTATVNPAGMVQNGSGYAALPNNNYIISAPITINTQPSISAFCAYDNAIISITSTPVDGYQWQSFIAGVWTDLNDDINHNNTHSQNLQIIAPPFSFNGRKYRVILRKNGNSCSVTSNEVILNLYDVPNITTPVLLVQCDDDNDGYTTVNLLQKQSSMAPLSNHVFTYYKTQTAAELGDQTSSSFIANPLNYYTNTSTVWVRIVEQTHGCHSVGQLDVNVTTTQIPQSFVKKYYKCDDYLDSFGQNSSNNNDRDGISSFDFSSATADILLLLPPTGTYNVKYYKNFEDASMEVDANGVSLEISQNSLAVENIYNYRNRQYPFQQNIWVRVESTIDNSCFGLGPYVKLEVEQLPVAHQYNYDNIIRHCDDNQDGIYGFNTSLFNNIIVAGQTNVNIQYFDAAGNLIPGNLPNPFFVNGTTTITARVVNAITYATDGPCYDEETLTFIVDKLPEAYPVNPSLLSVCDDEVDPLDQDGIYGFDTATIENSVLNGQTGVRVKYYDGNLQPLPSPLPNPFYTTSQNVTVVVENPINLTCPASTILPFKVWPTPKIRLQGRELICSDNPNFYKRIDADIVDSSTISNYTFQWYKEGVLIPGATLYTLDVNVPGLYSVDVTSVHGCLKTRVIDVVNSDVAHIDAIIVTDLTDFNSIEILASGGGDLVYSLDDPTEYQSSNIFYDVSMGIHQLYVNDLNGCGNIGPIDVYVLGIPKFFSPNGDKVNDYWNLRGTGENHQNKSWLNVFDRHGKLLHGFGASDLGWDGNYNGNPMPSDDYWYVIEMEDGRIFKGHFSLIR
ncbi:T9SS type B sorting domain-containing protein [Flavobacterium sp. CYK-55]|uniref:T9SS type B sorting domain-containing protein n=1 Tax=Flavobacterium sp. CYK-55 TaxID=2835529 RepID=UPI001BCE3BA7|nr:T9SS type B sorting domain-containing protein [Flavobacterium sp. CYK-55]MBS7786239.1 T9SS type B sorting domain-containing protein [Flavobacterium sp. CYK-55]